METTMTLALSAVILTSIGALIATMIFMGRSVLSSISLTTRSLQNEIGSMASAISKEIKHLEHTIDHLSKTIERLESRQWEQAKDIESLKAELRTSKE